MPNTQLILPEQSVSYSNTSMTAEQTPVAMTDENRVFGYQLITDSLGCVQAIAENNTNRIIVVNNSLAVTGTIINGTGTNGMYYYSSGTVTSTNVSVTGSIFRPTISTTTSNITSTWIDYYSTNGNWAPYQEPKVKQKEINRKRHSIRSSIKRALKLISNFGMEEDVRIFLGGNEVEVSHPESRFKFVISKHQNSIIHRTESPGYSTPYKLELYTKTDVHVANLCVYMQDTPLLDQVLALAMFVKSGNEESILEKANYNQLTKDIDLRRDLAFTYPNLKKKLRAEDVVFEQETNGCFNVTQSGIITGRDIVQNTYEGITQ